MSTTVQWVFDRAIHLMDEQREASGETLHDDTREYRFRTVSILNILRHELYPISDTYVPGGPPRTGSRSATVPVPLPPGRPATARRGGLPGRRDTPLRRGSHVPPAKATPAPRVTPPRI